MKTYDAIVLGSSPNALVCALRLAREGQSVVVLDARSAAGGPVATEAFSGPRANGADAANVDPGSFFADTCVSSGGLDPEIAEALDLRIEETRSDAITLLGESPVTLWASGPSAFRWPEAVEHAASVVGCLSRLAPPDLPLPAGQAAPELAGLAEALRARGPRMAHEALRLLFLPIADAVREWQLPEAACSLVAATALRHAWGGPFGQGTTFALLHQIACSDALFRRAPRGGMGAIAGALAEKARAAGVELRLGVRDALRAVVEDGAAKGVSIGGEETLFARRIFSDHDAKRTLGGLVSPRDLPPEALHAVRQTRCFGALARVHVALSDLPRFSGVSEAALGGTLVVAGSVADQERAWDKAKWALRRGALSLDPEGLRLHIDFPSLRAGGRGFAPEGGHTMSVSAELVPHGLCDREGVWRAVEAAVSRWAPGFADRVLAREVLLPEDLEARFGLTQGHVLGGELALHQAFFLRPLASAWSATPAAAPYATPIDNLYFCGSAAHPAGYSGRAGWNAASHA